MAWVILFHHHALQCIESHFLSRDQEATHRLTANALANIQTSQTSQLDSWQNQPERYEQLVAGAKKGQRKRTKEVKKAAQDKMEQLFKDTKIDESKG